MRFLIMVVMVLFATCFGNVSSANKSKLRVRQADEVEEGIVTTVPLSLSDVRVYKIIQCFTMMVMQESMQRAGHRSILIILLYQTLLHHWSESYQDFSAVIPMIEVFVAEMFFTSLFADMVDLHQVLVNFSIAANAVLFLLLAVVSQIVVLPQEIATMTAGIAICFMALKLFSAVILFVVSVALLGRFPRWALTLDIVAGIIVLVLVQ